MLTLRVEDIGTTFVTVIRIKGGRMLKVPITSELRSELLARAHPSGFVFGEDRYDGKPPTQAAVSVAFGRLTRKIGLPGVTHHVLRHTGASAMVAAGVSLRVVQEIGGWTSLRMLERYAHPTGEEMQRAVRVLSDQTTGTKTGTAPAVGESSDSEEACNALVRVELAWRPQRDFDALVRITRTGFLAA